MAYVIPVRGLKFGAGRGAQLLVIILTKDNLERMRVGDPFDIQPRQLGAQIPADCLVRDLDIVVAYEEDEAFIQQCARESNPAKLLRWLERGRVHQPGDAEPPVSIKPRVV